VVQRHEVTGTVGFVDVWSKATEHESASARPVFFFIHGGGWKGMSPRAHSGTCAHHALAAAGWVVVVCAYRKDRWPQHIDDATTALEWALELPGVSQQQQPLAIAGNSAGGHLAMLLTLRAIERGISVVGCVLGYPAADPYDEHGDYASLPVGCWWPFRYRRSQSLLAWYFERMVLRGRAELWDSARPLQHELLSAFPPTLVFHGELDSVVPIEFSERLLSALAVARPQVAPPTDCFVRLPGLRHSVEMDGGAAVQVLLAGIVAWLGARCHGQSSVALNSFGVDGN